MVCFKRGDVIVRYGIVAIKTIDQSWLLHPEGPRIGIEFESRSDLRRVLSEIGLHSVNTCDIYGAGQNFFAYEPVLRCLQSTFELPLEEELIYNRPSNLTLTYLPRNVTLPSDFGSVRLDLENWDDSRLLKNTTLDNSQIAALRVALTTRVSLIQGPPGTGKLYYVYMILYNFEVLFYFILFQERLSLDR